MQSDHAWGGAFVEMTVDRIANPFPQRSQVVCFCENSLTKRPRRVSALGCFGDYENNLVPNWDSGAVAQRHLTRCARSCL